MNKTLFENTLDEGFFAVLNSVYHPEPEWLRRELEKTRDLFRIRQQQDAIYLVYNDHVRLAGIFPPNSKTAYFGYWEGINDLKTHREAFDHILEEAATRAYTTLIGPINFNTFHSYRIRLQSPASWTSFPGEPNNPDYYADILAGCGFEISRRYSSHYISPEEVKKVYAKQELYLKSLDDIPFEKIPLDEKFWNENLPELFTLIQAIFSANPNFHSISFDEFCMDYGKDYAKMICPNTSVLFTEKTSGKWAAISLCLPNYHELKDVVGPYSFETHYPLLKRKTFLAKTIGVHPEFRNQHLMRYLAAHGMLRFPEFYDDAIFCLMRDDNISNSFTARHQKEIASYALFRKEIR